MILSPHPVRAAARPEIALNKNLEGDDVEVSLASK